MTTRKRKPVGSLHKGSIPWHASKLQPGESFFVKNQESFKNYQAALQLTINRAKTTGALKGEYSILSCIGHRMNFNEPIFKFFEIKRLK